MKMHREDLLKLLAQYEPSNLSETAYVTKTKFFVRNNANCFSRLSPSHITGSAWVINPQMDKILMLHHKKQNQWFQPGGHADCDADIRRVALRETQEETGVSLKNINLLSETIFDVDIHTIPKSKHGPRHTHYDIRFLLEIGDNVKIPGNDESHKILWVPLHKVSQLNSNLSTYRMIEKTRKLRNKIIF